jgi:cytochrome c oxidase assembly protein subunit 15
LLIPEAQLVVNKALRNFALWIVGMLTVQLIYGAFMAGLKAAVYAPTWPDINGEFFPSLVYTHGNQKFQGLSFLTDNPFIVHFIHRTLGYILTILIFVWWMKARKVKGPDLFNKIRSIPLLIVIVQVILGVFTVLNPLHATTFLWLGVAHQFVAMLLLLSMIMIIYVVRNRD